MPSPPPAADDPVPELSPEELDRNLSGILGRAGLLRIYDRTGKRAPARKRRHRTSTSLLTDATDPEAIAAIAATFRLRPDSEIMAWMSWPDLWFEFADERGAVLAMLGWLAPGWLRWEPHGDLQLVAPDALEKQLHALGLHDHTP